jgi:hypothetical protein
VASDATPSLRGCSAEHVGGGDLILNVEDALQQRKQLLGVLSPLKSQRTITPAKDRLIWTKESQKLPLESKEFRIEEPQQAPATPQFALSPLQLGEPAEGVLKKLHDYRSISTKNFPTTK